MRIYLSGAIEYAPDRGRAWRAELTPFLESLGHSVYDPARDERKNLSDEELTHFRSWKSSDPDRFQRVVRKIIDHDLNRIADRTDCVICYWDEYAQRGAGTQGEVTFAYRLNIPVYLVTSLPVTSVSGWILGCSSKVFRDLAGLRHELQAQTVGRSAGVGV